MSRSFPSSAKGHRRGHLLCCRSIPLLFFYGPGRFVIPFTGRTSSSSIAMDPSSPLALLLILTATTLDHRAGAVPSNNIDGFSFKFNGIPKNTLTMDGAAVVESSGLLQLTNHTQSQKGHAFYPAAVRFKQDGNPSRLLSFSTTFIFAIVPMEKEMKSGTHGMAFVVSPSPRLNNDVEGTYLGVFNSRTNGNASNHIFAVEFDLIKNPNFGDINDNHVGIDVNGLISVAAASAGYYATEADGKRKKLTNLTLPSGAVMQLWVDYDAANTLVEVTLAPLNVSAVGRPKTPLLSTKIASLSDVFLDTMYMGFAGATGKNAPVSQYILGWSFQLGRGLAPPLDLGKLPKLPKIKSSNQQLVLLAIFVPIATAAFLLVVIVGTWLLWQRKKKFAEILEDWEIELYGPSRFSYKDLYVATKGFSEKELLGTGGFGAVYRGVLRSSGSEVAVKRVSHDSRQGIREFVAEIVSIGRLRHRNLVQLLGYCRRKGELLLVYDYMPNGSLDALLFEDSYPSKPSTLDALLHQDNNGNGKTCALDWNRRFHIIKGVSAGLQYLHEEWEQVVIHRDVKASNVLLDRDFNGRLGDFGLARLYDHGTLPRTTHVVGTMGYIAPDLTRLGKASEATDVFAFGVFLLEVVCGRRPIEVGAPHEEVVLVDWVLRRWMKGGKLVDCLDKRIRVGENYSTVEVELVIKLGLLCSHAVPESRPSMRQVMQILNGDLQLPEVSSDYWSGTVPSVVTNDGFDDFLTKSSASSSTAVATVVGQAALFRSGGR